MGPTVYSTGVPSTANIDVYREAKLKILKRDFRITLSLDEIIHVKSLKTEIAIDNFCISAINRHWN